MRKRDEETWDIPEVQYDPSPAADIERKRCLSDFRYFFQKVWCHGNKDFQEKYGRVHDFLIDFLRIDELAQVPADHAHSDLRKYLPVWTDDKGYAERWIYWPTLGQPPEIQDGPTGDIAQMFHERQWGGLLVRVIGDGRDKCVLMPRGHLKSTIATECHTLWEMLRDPSLRTIIRSQTHPLALKNLYSVKRHFHENPEFVRLFGCLGPPDKNELIWTAQAIQVRTKTRRGSEPTLDCCGLGTEVTGRHADRIKCDDVVGEKNAQTTEQRQKVREQIYNLESVRDPGSYYTDIGTIWSDDDAHREYIRRDGHSYSLTSFIVGTLRMADGSALWPQKFSESEIHRLETKFAGNIYMFMCQFYNQPLAEVTRTFKQEWLRHEDFAPEQKAVEGKLSIFITCDPASSTKKHSDYSACIVQGQAADGKRYVLDGFRDRLGPQELPGRLAEIIIKWQKIARQAGTSFRFGIEAFSFGEYIKPALLNELRTKGASCLVEELKHNYKSKADRVAVLAGPYSMGMVVWPRHISKASLSQPGKTYDLVDVLKQEYLRFGPRGAGQHDDLLDAQAYGEIFMNPMDFAITPIVEETVSPFAYTRKAADELPEERPAREGRYFAGAYSRGNMPESRLFPRRGRGYEKFLSP